jgi:hypothetical protein
MVKLTFTFWLILAFEFLISQSVAQSSSDPEDDAPRFEHRLGSNFDLGFVMPTNAYLRGDYLGGEPVRNYGSLSVEFGWQTSGEKLWHKLYGNPGWGVGIYHAEFGRPEDLGMPWALFGYYEGPFKRWKRASIHYHYRMGLSLGWKPFDPVDNPFQISLGSSRAVYANLRIFFRYHISNSFDLEAGVAFSHFSNGSTVKPNKGINMIAPAVGVHYTFDGKEDTESPVIIPEYEDNWEWYAAFNFGQKQVVFDTTNALKEIDRRYIGVNYNIFGISSAIYRQFSHKSKFGAGIDFLYDESINANIDTENDYVVQSSSNFADRVAIGIYPAYELAVNKLSFLVQGGIYVVRKKRPHQIPAFYQRLGMKYHVLRNVFIGINIKAYNMKVADFIEWNAGYRLRWNS